ncbi:hypothetical protein LX36DRAFT_290801 [Colletotrichum falcatum]|nr:hypothetical protein LX36DRAFT_290801 [Colletotrichum falcatum]
MYARVCSWALSVSDNPHDLCDTRLAVSGARMQLSVQRRSCVSLQPSEAVIQTDHDYTGVPRGAHRIREPNLHVLSLCPGVRHPRRGHHREWGRGSRPIPWMRDSGARCATTLWDGCLRAVVPPRSVGIRNTSWMPEIRSAQSSPRLLVSSYKGCRSRGAERFWEDDGNSPPSPTGRSRSPFRPLTLAN